MESPAALYTTEEADAPPTVAPSSVTPLVQVIKRTLDLTLALIGLALTVPLYPLIMLAIVLDSRGPVFYRQRRAGRLIGGGTQGRALLFDEFAIIKFRTMRADAESTTGAVLAREGDPRVSRVGRFLRRTRIDELPQFWNVLFGHMSVVGPRPERPELLTNLALAIPFFEERMRGVKPGITGLAQIELSYTGRPHAGSEVAGFVDTLTNPYKLPDAEGALADDMRVKLLYDLAYCAAFENVWSFLRMELRIMLLTPLVMLRGSGR
jgi:lipopolysaccharide/colanic/teichoic acid biosynthesis glycosyltransferase